MKFIINIIFGIEFFYFHRQQHLENLKCYENSESNHFSILVFRNASSNYLWIIVNPEYRAIFICLSWPFSHIFNNCSHLNLSFFLWCDLGYLRCISRIFAPESVVILWAISFFSPLSLLDFKSLSEWKHENLQTELVLISKISRNILNRWFIAIRKVLAKISTTKIFILSLMFQSRLV